VKRTFYARPFMAGGRFEQTSSLDACQKQRRRDRVPRRRGGRIYIGISRTAFEALLPASSGSPQRIAWRSAGNGSGVWLRSSTRSMAATHSKRLVDGRATLREIFLPPLPTCATRPAGSESSLHCTPSRVVPAQTLGIATRCASLHAPREMLRASFFAKREQACFQIRPTMHFPYLVIPIGSFASNATGSRPAPLRATL
jgi:hypothetical protein